MTKEFHPFYISKAKKVLAGLSVPDADPLPLAEWAQDAAMEQIAIITAGGEIVGHATYQTVPTADDTAVAYIDKETASRYDLPGKLVLDLAVAKIGFKLGKPVVYVKRSLFGSARTLNVIDTYARNHGLTRYAIAKKTGVSPTMLQRASQKTVSKMSGEVFSALGQAAGQTPGTVMDELIRLEVDNA